ncbi:MAG: ABC transporter ATP-binding protein [Acidobacteria bacterium]|nr:ABC transporter ATP-binding protein [Acidobacteriota bacterium]
MSAIQVRNVAKMYRLYPNPTARLKEMFTLNRRPYHQEFWALDGISFDVERGGVFGVIGPNGSGKSTLLEIVTGTLEPTRGRVITHGRLAALLSLGAGFNPEFTGRENVFLNGEIMGLSRQEIQKNFPHVERFAEIGKFMDRPVKTYSTGMYVRLAFAAAIHVEPEILVVDEVLAVGDAIFVNRCVRKFEELRERGLTVLLVTHDVSLVKLLCDRAMLLYRGRILAQGDPDDVVNRYNGLVLERQRAFEQELPPPSADGAEEMEPLEYTYRHGDRQSVVAKVEMYNESGRSALVFRSGENVRVRVVAHFRERHERPVVGMMIRNRIGMDVFGTNTELEDACPGPAEAGDFLEVNFSFACWLTPQEYTLTVATQSPDGTSHDWLDGVLSFQVVDTRRTAGVANLNARVTSRRLKSRESRLAIRKTSA